MKTAFRIKRPKKLLVKADIKEIPKNYLERLVALIPAEVISLYLALVNFTSGSVNQTDAGINISENHWIPFIGLALVIFVRIMGTRVLIPKENGKQTWDIEWPLVIISALSFIIWVYATGGSFISGDIKLFGSIGIGAAVLIWTFIVPYIYKEN